MHQQTRRLSLGPGASFPPSLSRTPSAPDRPPPLAADRLETRTAALGLNVQLLPPAGQAAARHLGALAGGLGLHSAEEGPMAMAFVAQDMEAVREEREQVRGAHGQTGWRGVEGTGCRAAGRPRSACTRQRMEGGKLIA